LADPKPGAGTRGQGGGIGASRGRGGPGRKTPGAAWGRLPRAGAGKGAPGGTGRARSGGGPGGGGGWGGGRVKRIPGGGGGRGGGFTTSERGALWGGFQGHQGDGGAWGPPLSGAPRARGGSFGEKKRGPGPPSPPPGWAGAGVRAKKPWLGGLTNPAGGHRGKNGGWSAFPTRNPGPRGLGKGGGWRPGGWGRHPFFRSRGGGHRAKPGGGNKRFRRGTWVGRFLLQGGGGGGERAGLHHRAGENLHGLGGGNGGGGGGSDGAREGPNPSGGGFRAGPRGGGVHGEGGRKGRGGGGGGGPPTAPGFSKGGQGGPGQKTRAQGAGFSARAGRFLCRKLSWGGRPGAISNSLGEKEKAGGQGCGDSGHSVVPGGPLGAGAQPRFV